MFNICGFLVHVVEGTEMSLQNFPNLLKKLNILQSKDSFWTIDQK